MTGQPTDRPPRPDPRFTPHAWPTLPKPTATPLALILILALLALLLTRGIGGDFGLNVPLICGLLVVGVLTVLRRSGIQLQPAALIALALGLTCALGLALRDGALMTWLNVLGLSCALTLGLAFVRLPGLARSSVGGLLLSLIWGGLRGFSGLPLSAARFPWRRLRPRAGLNRARSIGLGLLFSVPLLGVFGALLSGADARFGSLVSGLVHPDLGDLPHTALLFGGWAFALGGPVYAALLTTRAHPLPEETGRWNGALGLIELGLPLFSLSLLFCTYLAVQASYLFDRGLHQGFTYSEYVRRGFGELTTVALLTLGVLLLTHTLLRRDLRTTMAYRLLSAAVLAPLAMLIVSAYSRLSLYVAAYGLSEVRVLGAVFLAWVTLSLAVYAVLLWRGGLERFAYFSLISGLSLTAGLNGLNPGRLIASVNVTRDVLGVRNDLRSSPQQASPGELLLLGADAVPVILAHLDALTGSSAPGGPRPTRDQLLRDLRARYAQGPGDWRTWNWARARARGLVLATTPGSGQR